MVDDSKVGLDWLSSAWPFNVLKRPPCILPAEFAKCFKKYLITKFVLFPQRLSVFKLPYLHLVLFKHHCWPGPLMIKHSLSKSTDINEDFVKSADNSDKARQAVISYVLSMWEMSFRGNFLYRAMHCIDKGWKSSWQNFLYMYFYLYLYLYLCL